MKVKVHVIKEVEVEVNDPAVAALDAFWRNNEITTSDSPGLNEMVDKAVLAVEAGHRELSLASTPWTANPFLNGKGFWG